MTVHETHSNWRVVGRGNRWQVQQFVKTDHGDGWWDIGHPRESEKDALTFMYRRQPKKTD